MRLPLAFRPEARDDLEEAYAWYEGQRPGLGEDLLAAVRAALDRIRRNPGIYAQVHRDVRRASVRRFPYGVFYRTEKHRIVIVAVYHAARDPAGWQARA
jgi:plasmid stabilization system protein ParE